MDNSERPINQAEILLDSLHLGAELRAHPEIKRAAQIATNLLAQVEADFGDGTTVIRSPQTGNYMSFHHGRHSREVLDGSVQHLMLSGQGTPTNIAKVMVASSGHDLIYSHTEPGMNEHLSAIAVCEMLADHGIDADFQRDVYGGVVGTIVKRTPDGHIRQTAYDSPSPIAEAVAIGDLGTLSKQLGPARSLTLFAESNPQVLDGHDEPLSQIDIMKIIDANPAHKQTFINYVKNQGGFFAVVQLPPRAATDFDTYHGHHQANIDFLNDLGQRLEAGQLTAAEAYQAALDYADQ